GVRETSRGAVQDDGARSRLAAHRVRLEARPVVDVDDLDPLVLDDVGRLHEEGINGDRALVVEVGAGHGRPVNLGLAHHSLHDPPAHMRITLSISRVCPTKAATASTFPGLAGCVGWSVSGSTPSTYCTRTPGRASSSCTSRRSRSASRSPPANASAARVRPR